MYTCIHMYRYWEFGGVSAAGPPENSKEGNIYPSYPLLEIITSCSFVCIFSEF